MPLAPGETIAGYTVVRQLGSGGMGAVYLVKHPRLPRLDALKLLKSEFSADPDFSRRFLREADVVAGLSHRNIVAVLDRGEDRGQLWLTMQYIEGIDAEQALEAAGGLLPPDRVAHIVTEVAAALDAAHRHHLIHRDVKPANILLSPSSDDDDEPEQVFLTDFGIAKSLQSGSTRLTRTGAVLATFDYASPEQIESRSPDARSDIYSLACVLYKLLTGSVPFPGPGVAAAIHGHLQLPPPTPTKLVPWLAPRIDDVIVRAMNKDPAERYQTCRAFAAAAASALVDFPAPPAPPYTVQLTGPTGALLGPMTTERLSSQETERLVDLVRRTRFFDLPENLHEVAGRTTTGHRPRGGRPVTLEIRAGRSVRRVVADLDEARRPATLDALVEAVQKLPPPPGQAPAPATRLNDLRSAQAAIAARAAQRSPQTSAPPPPGTGTAASASPPRTSTPPVHQQAPPQYPGQGSQQPAYSFAPTTPAGQSTGQPPRHPTGPYGPAGPVYTGPATPWTPVPGQPAEKKRRGALLAVVVVVVLLAAAGVLIWLLTRADEDPTGGGDGSSSSSGSETSEAGGSTTPADAAYADLPRGTVLPDATLVIPRQVDGNVDLYLVDAATGATGARLTSDPEQELGPILAPDRDTVLYVRKTGTVDELWVVSTDGSGHRPLFPSGVEGCAAPSRPAWNPAQPTELVIACNDDPGATALRVVALDGTVARTLETGFPRVDDLTFSGDGTTVAYWAGASDAGAGNIYIQRVDGSEAPHQLTDAGSDNDVVWSSSGRLAFARGQGSGGRQIVAMDADGTDVSELTSGFTDQGPVWSPDGSEVAFKSTRPAPDTAAGDHYWVVDAGGGDARLIDTEGVVVSTAAWGHR